MDALKLTVGICTWNRCELLGHSLKQLRALRRPRHVELEIVVVDNNSSDDTPELLRSYLDRLPLRVLHEARPGKSHAANLLVQEARGDYILWTDDDVLVDEGWVEAYAAAFARHPEASIFGGPVVPWFPNDPPAWLERGFTVVENAYAALDLGSEELALSHERFPFGANMALRRSAHLRRPFNPAFGPRPGVQLRGEEMVLVRELLALGETGWWVPDARVRHYVPPDRQTLRYLRDYYLGSGRCLAQLSRAPGRLFFAGRPAWLWRQAMTHELLYRLRRPFAPPEQWLHHMREAAIGWGWLWWYGTDSEQAE